MRKLKATMMKRISAVTLMFSLLLIFSPTPAAEAAPRCFPEAAPAITDCIDGRFDDYWARQGGLPVFGYPISPQGQIGALTVQLFERARLELHPENASPYDVQLGRLGVDLLAKQGRDWNAFPKSDPAAEHFFAQTGHAIAPQFWGYWSSHGLELDGQPGITADEALALFGLPLSEAQTETSPTDGQPYLTQWFERARFEYHAEHAGTPDEIQLGLLQRELGTGGVTAPAPAAAPAPASAPAASPSPASFIQASGGQLMLKGQPVLVKGVNYYPQWHPWASMWRDWDAPQIERELRDGRDRLGINVVRVLLPYNFTGGKTGDGQVTDRVIERLREISQIAGSLDMRLIVTLFDFSRNFSGPNTDLETQNLNYLRALIPNFANDDRIMAWDLHNEPDNYGIWTAGNPGKVLDWLGRMADTVHALAPHQLVTVGMGQASSLWIPGPDGRRVIDYSDVVSMHSYDAGTVARDVAQLRAQTTKPILIEEFGWPTGPACTENYSESTQTRLYRAVLDAAKGTSGVVAWTLRDYDSGPTDRWDTREEHFGLIRPDGSLKPAAELLRAVSVPALPGATETNVPLTSVHPRNGTGSDAPLLVPGTSFYVKDRFRKAWELLGGRGSFGLPLSEAFERQSDGRVVQYFENAVLEFHPRSNDTLRGLPQDEKARQEIQPADLGSAFAAGRNLPPAQPPRGPFLDFYNGNNGPWRLGNPISGELTEDVNGAPITVQYFERGRLELNISTRVITLGQLGKADLDARCQKAQ